MKFDINKLQQFKTPFYWYDMALLKETLSTIKKESDKYGYHVHYAVKANANLPILKLIKEHGFGTDCVSGNEVKRSLDAGFTSEQVVFAGVGKSDEEIETGLKNDIFCFNSESLVEIEIINELAEKLNKTARIALRINPNVSATTHHYITTGLDENKFGISMGKMEEVIDRLKSLKNIELVGIHFHIGSQITNLQDFKGLCLRVNEIQKWFYARNIIVDHVNVGGGLGVNYQSPDSEEVPDFAAYFKTFNDFIELRPKQQLHFELGRAVVAQCGTLISKVLYVKQGIKTNFVIVDAGMTELIRPALYQALHMVQNISSTLPQQKYDVVGPICESSDFFAKEIMLPETNRSDLMAIRTAGAYGEVMSSRYNLREIAKAYYSNEV